MSTPDTKNASRAKAGGIAWTALGTVLVVVIALMINFVSFRRYERWDWTSEGLFTLSDRTEQMLVGLDKDVDIYLFIGAGDPIQAEVKELIQRYRARSQRIAAHFVDPDRSPTKFRALAEKYGLRAAVLESGETVAELSAIVTSGDKQWSINHHDLIAIDNDAMGLSPEEAKVNVKTEQALTGAIVQVTSGRSTRVCVTEGHGEWSLEGTDRSLYGVTTELKRENVEFRTVATRGEKSLPKDCDAVYVVGPLKPFTSDESKLLESYIAGGGNLLLALDPVLAGEGFLPTGFEGLLGSWGVRAHADIAVELDRSHLLSPSPVEHFLVSNYTDHATVRALSAIGAPVVMHLARSFGVGEGATAEPLLRSSDKAYGETNLGALTAGDEFTASPEDLPGPLVLAAAVDTRESDGSDDLPGGRAILVGDSEWLAGNYLQSPEVANVDLLSMWTGWLTERDALVSIAPRKIDALPILITEDALFGVFWRVVLAMPLASLILGLGIWWQRRS